MCKRTENGIPENHLSYNKLWETCQSWYQESLHGKWGSIRIFVTTTEWQDTLAILERFCMLSGLIFTSFSVCTNFNTAIRVAFFSWPRDATQPPLCLTLIRKQEDLTHYVVTFSGRYVMTLSTRERNYGDVDKTKMVLFAAVCGDLKFLI